MGTKKMIVSIHQPMYLPWAPYICKIALSDIFVVFDNVQYPGGKSLTNRNYIKQNNTDVLLTLPIKKHPLGTKIYDIEINNSTNILRKHYKSIKLCYKNSLGSRFLDDLEPLYYLKENNINFVDYCIWHIELILKYLNIETKIIKSSDLISDSINGKDKINEILKSLNATHYITGTGAGSIRYLDIENLLKNNIIVQKIIHNEIFFNYGSMANQKLSFVDMLFTLGAECNNHIFANSKIQHLKDI